MTNLDSILKNRDTADKGPSSQGYGFSSSHVWMWELDNKKGWALKNWCLWIVILEKTLGSPLDSKIKPVNLKGNQHCIFIGRTDAEVEAPILWPPNGKRQLIGKDPDAWKDWRQEDKGKTRWNGWIASLTQWTWVWANSRRQSRPGKPDMLQSMGLQRLGHEWATEQQCLCDSGVHNELNSWFPCITAG